MAIKMPDPNPQYAHSTQLPIEKLRNASAVLLSAEEVWQVYTASTSLRYETVKDHEQHAVLIIVRLDSPPPIDELNALLRICINEGRSALDNLATYLARAHGATDEQLRRTSFPVANTDAEWKKSNWARLGLLPDDTRDRVRNVQPFTSPEQLGPSHPLTLLHELWNADKHRDSFSAAVAFSPPAGQSRLPTLEMTINNNDHLDTLGDYAREVDRNVDLDFGPIQDGTQLLLARLPEDVGLDQVTVESVNVQLTMGLIGPGISIPDSAIALFENALRYAREAVRYVAGGRDALPVVFPPGLVETA